MTVEHQYLTSFYFIITTLSTVGYGDISASNVSEKVFCIIIMCVGVTAFAAATSTLTNLLQTYDMDNKEISEKVDILNRIKKEYFLPIKLYENVKKSIKYQHNNNIEDMIQFVGTLPQDLKLEVTLFIYESTFKQFDFFYDRPISFITWICPLLKPLIKLKDQYVFFEGDDISGIYFMQNGNIGYVLPRHQNVMYIRLNAGLYFGVSCIVGSFMEQDDFDIENWIKSRDKLRRQFTIQCKDQCELLTLSIHDLDVMKNEFREAYMNLFENSFCNLRRTIQVKLKAIQYANKFLNVGTEDLFYSNTFGVRRLTTKLEQKKEKYKFEPIDQRELEDSS